MRRSVVLATLLISLFSTSAYAQVVEISPRKISAIELKQTSSKARIVALANGSAEIIAALGLKSSLVGRDIASSTSELNKVAIVTSGHQVIAEKVIALKPTLVIVDENTGPKTALESIRAARIQVRTISSAWNIDDMYRKILEIGSAVGQSQSALQLISLMKTKVAKAQISIGWKPRVVFLYLRGPSSIYLIGGKGSGADSLLNAIGAIDSGARQFSQPFNTLTSEALVTTNPDLILVMTKGLESVGGIKGLLALPGISQTAAGKNKRVISVDDSLLLSFGPRTPALLSSLAEAMRSLR